MKPKILVPFDFSAPAEQALAWAADLQGTAKGPPILMVHAIDSRPPGTAGIELQMLLPSEDEVAALKRRMIDAARGHDVLASATVVVRSSLVGDIILDEASGAGVELIVMGTHGRTGVKRLFLGSVAEHVLRHATCPVVTVHGPREK